MKLTEKQKRFCDYYIKNGGNATQSYIDAGYKGKGNTANVNANRMLINANITNYIEERNKKIGSERIADMTEVKELWSNILRGNLEGVEIKDILKASEYIAKTNAAFIDKLEHSGEIKTKNPLDGLSTEDLKKLAKDG